MKFPLWGVVIKTGELDTGNNCKAVFVCGRSCQQRCRAPRLEPSAAHIAGRAPPLPDAAGEMRNEKRYKKEKKKRQIRTKNSSTPSSVNHQLFFDVLELSGFPARPDLPRTPDILGGAVGRVLDGIAAREGTQKGHFGVSLPDVLCYPT